MTEYLDVTVISSGGADGMWTIGWRSRSDPTRTGECLLGFLHRAGWRWLAAAEVLVARADDTGPDPRSTARTMLRGYPGCALAVILQGDRLLAHTHRTWRLLPAPDSGDDATLAASVVLAYVELLCGRPGP